MELRKKPRLMEGKDYERFYPALMEAGLSLNAALYLSHMYNLYWFFHHREWLQSMSEGGEPEWFYRDHQAITKRIGLSRKQQAACRREVAEAGFLIARTKSNSRDRTYHYWVDADSVYKWVQSRTTPNGAFQNDELVPSKVTKGNSLYKEEKAHKESTIESTEKASQAPPSAPGGVREEFPGRREEEEEEEGEIPFSRFGQKAFRKDRVISKNNGRLTIIKTSFRGRTSRRGGPQDGLGARTARQASKFSSEAGHDIREGRTLEELLDDYQGKPATAKNLLEFWKLALHVIHGIVPSPGNKQMNLAQMGAIIRVAGEKHEDKRHLYGDLAKVARRWWDFCRLREESGYSYEPQRPSLRAMCDMVESIPTFVARCACEISRDDPEGRGLL